MGSPIYALLTLSNPRDPALRPLHRVPYVGPVKVAFDNRQCYVGALVLGNEVLLGSVPMEDMDVLISPARQELIVNPANPNMAVSVVK